MIHLSGLPRALDCRNMDYHQRPYHGGKENSNPRDPQYEALTQQLSKLQQEIKQKDLMLKESKEYNHQIKHELLLVSKKETEDYANDMEIYSNNFLEMKQQEETLKHQLEKYKKAEEQLHEKIQTLAMGVEQAAGQNQRKEDQIHKMEQQNMKLQHGAYSLHSTAYHITSHHTKPRIHSLSTSISISVCFWRDAFLQKNKMNTATKRVSSLNVLPICCLSTDKRLLQQQLQSVRDNFFNDDTLMRVLCGKLELESCSNFNGLASYISNAKRLHSENGELKETVHCKSESLEAHKIELASFKKQIEIYEDNKDIEKGHLITMNSLRSENENLRNEIRILEEGNTKLSVDLVKRSQTKMQAMTESLTKMQQEHNKMYSDYEKKLDKVRRERKAYQHKYEHFKKEAKGHASKCEELTQKVSDLEHIVSKYQGNDDNMSEDYERRMTEVHCIHCIHSTPCDHHGIVALGLCHPLKSMDVGTMSPSSLPHCS